MRLHDLKRHKTEKSELKKSKRREHLKTKIKSKIFIGALLIIVSVLLCCIVGTLNTEKASASTDIVSTQTFTGTEEVSHTKYVDVDFTESKSVNTGIKFYSTNDNATGTTTNTNTVKLNGNSFYIDFNSATPLQVSSRSYAYIDTDYYFGIQNSAGDTVFSVEYFGTFEEDYNFEYCNYYFDSYLNGEQYVWKESTDEDLIRLSPSFFGRHLVNLPDGDYTITIQRVYLWTDNQYMVPENGFLFYCGWECYEAHSTIRGKIQIRKSVPTISITDTSGSQVASGSSTNQRVKFTADGDFFSKIYYKTPTSGEYVSTTSKTYTIGTANGWYYAYSQDIFGKTSDTVSIYYDGTVPIGTIYANGTTVADGSYISSTFYYIATDTESGINSLYYKSPISGIYTPYSSGSIIPVNAGDGWYYFYAVDKVGNRSETTSVYLETQPPLVEIYRNGTKEFSKSFSTSASYDTDVYLNLNDILRIECTTSSGRVSSDHALNTDIVINDSYNVGSNTITITSATGIVGGFTYHVVKQKPTIAIDGVYYESGSTLYFNTDKTVTFADDTTIVNSAHTGATIQAGNNTEFISYSSGKGKELITAEGMETVYNLTLNDRAGNESTFTVVIDKLAPQGIWQTDGRELENGGYTQKPLTFKFTEAGVTGEYSFNNSGFKPLKSGQTFTADGMYTVALCDLANNRSTFIAYIDTAAPTGQLYANYIPVLSDSVTNTKVYFTWDGTDNFATVNGQAYEKNTVLSEDGVYTFVLSDLANNTTTYVIEIDTVAPTYNANKLIGSELKISKWYNVSFDQKDYSFATFTEALEFASSKEFDKAVTVLTLNDVGDFNQHHLIAGNSEVRTGEYWLYKSRANAESYLYYFDRELLNEVIAFYAKDYVSDANHFVWNGDNVYGDTAESMTDNLLTSSDGTNAPSLNGVVFDMVDGVDLYAEFVGSGTRTKLNYGIAFDKQISVGGLYKFTEMDEAGNETVFFGILDKFAPELKVLATIYGNESAKELNISKESLTSTAAYYYVSFEVGEIIDADKWSVISVTSADVTTYYTFGDTLPCLTEGGEYLLSVYDRLGNGFSFTVYIVGNPATITIQNNDDDTAFDIAITLEQNFDTVVFLEISRNGEILTGVSTNKLYYTFDRAGYYTINLRDNFGRMIMKEYVFNKSLPSGNLIGVENGGKTKTDVVFSFDNTKYFATVNKDGQDYATNYNGEIYFFGRDRNSGYYMVRLIRLTDTENYTDYTFIINTLAPEFVLSVADGTTTNKNVIVTWTASDIVQVTYSRNNAEVIELQNGATLSDEGEYTIVATNDLGTQSIKTFAIDKTLDYAILINNTQTVGIDVTNKDVMLVNNEPLSVTATKNGSPYDFDFGQVISDEGIYSFRISDEYGNNTTISVVIDKSVDLKATIGNGVISNKDVIISSSEKVNLIVTRNGAEYGYEIGSPLKEEGLYKLTAYDLYGNEKTLSFQIIKSTKTALDYTLGNNVKIKSIMLDGEAVQADGNRLNFTVDGTYVVVCEADGKEYSFELALDTTAPTINLNGISNGGKGNVTVTITDLSEEGTVEVYKDGERIEYNLGDELKEYGSYEVRVRDELGNEQTYKFVLKYQMNGGAIALIVIGILIAVGIVVAIIFGKKAVYKKKFKNVQNNDNTCEDSIEE